MGSPRSVCHRCRHKWKTKGFGADCPKCGHNNVGPTDPAPGVLLPIVIVLVLIAAAAWYFGLVPDEAKKAVESTVQDVRKEVEKRVPTDDPEAPTVTPRTSKPPARNPAKAKRPVARPKETKVPDPPAAPLPNVVVSSKSGAATSNTFFVKGKIENTGTVEATGVKVVVTFKDSDGGRVATVEARCPPTLEAGKRAKYEAAVAGADAERVDGFSVAATWER